MSVSFMLRNLNAFSFNRFDANAVRLDGQGPRVVPLPGRGVSSAVSGLRLLCAGQLGVTVGQNPRILSKM